MWKNATKVNKIIDEIFYVESSGSSLKKLNTTNNIFIQNQSILLTVVAAYNLFYFSFSN